MKRTWIGVGLLLTLLLGGVLIARWMERQHTPMVTTLTRAARAAMAEEWEQAEALAVEADGVWKQKRTMVAAFADHSPMEEIDGLFAELEIFRDAREQVHFAATCMELSRKMEAMGDAHSLSWWNLL